MQYGGCTAAAREINTSYTLCLCATVGSVCGDASIPKAFLATYAPVLRKPAGHRLSTAGLGFCVSCCCVHIYCLASTSIHNKRIYSVVVSTPDFESGNPVLVDPCFLHIVQSAVVDGSVPVLRQSQQFVCAQCVCDVALSK